MMEPSRLNSTAFGIGLSVGVARWCFECLFVVPLVPDPQSPIWIMVATVTSVFIAVTVGGATWLTLRAWESKSVLFTCAGVLLSVVLLGWYSTGFIKLAQMRSALVDSANPNTESDRLRELVDYNGGPGYEVDNRVAMHPNTPPDVLRSLHGRPDQIGTEMCLAQNPNTPDDVLLAIGGNGRDGMSKFILDALRRNPRYKEVFNLDDADAEQETEPSDAPTPTP